MQRLGVIELLIILLICLLPLGIAGVGLVLFLLLSHKKKAQAAPSADEQKQTEP